MMKMLFQTGAYKQLERECAELVHSLREKVSARRDDLALPLTDAARARCRLAPPDLTVLRQRPEELEQGLRWAAWTDACVRVCVAGGGGGGRGGAGARVGRGRARRRVVGAARPREPRLHRARRQHALRGAPAPRSSHPSERDGGRGCFGYTRFMYEQAFNPDILAPLEESAARLPLESGAGARAWEQRCARAAPPDLVAGAGAWGAGGAPRVPPPALDLQAFSPRAHGAPPLPHPATVALVLHNRYVRPRLYSLPPHAPVLVGAHLK